MSGLFFTIYGTFIVCIFGFLNFGCCLIFDKSDVFQGDNIYEKTAVILGWSLNFVFAIIAQYSFDMSFLTQVEDYLKLTRVITKLIEIPDGSDFGRENGEVDIDDIEFSCACNCSASSWFSCCQEETEKRLDNDGDDDDAPIMEDGVPVLTLDDSQNLLSWMELRDNVCIEGMKIFGDLELFVFCIAFWMIGLSTWLCVQLLSQENEQEYMGETFFAIVCLYALSILWIFKVLFFGSKFDLLQKRQTNAINNQMHTIIFKTTYFDEIECIGPTKWEQLAINTWDNIHDLLEKYKKEKKEDCFRDLIVRKGELESHLRTMEFCLRKLEQYPINPQIFGIGLTGALTKTLAGSVLFPLISYLINQYFL